MASTAQQEVMPFLAVEGELDDKYEVWSKRNHFQQNRYARVHCILLGFQLVVLALSTTFLLFNATSVKNHEGSHPDTTAFKTAFSPAESVLKYIIVEEPKYKLNPSRYTGEPRPDLD
ncbi:hypothetical protein F4801DRAFT_584091 [Xylaria longipes]|nr:hypothetical protein F4801DRAFT_584091 [Xylaria longipes]